MQREKGAATTIDFSDEPLTVTGDRYELGASGRRPYDVVQDCVSNLLTALQQMKDGELNAIDQFLQHMAFKSSADARPDVLGAGFKAVADELWKIALDKVPEAGGVNVAGKVWAVATAMSDELERAAAAQQEFDLAVFMSVLRGRASATYQAQIIDLASVTRGELDAGYAGSAGEWDKDTNVVVGEKAAYLRELDRVGEAALRAVPKPIEYEERLITRWVTDRRAGGAPRGFDTTGVIQLKYETERSDDSYSFDLQSARVRTAHHEKNAADMLNRIMGETGKRVYEFGIPVQVMLRTENTMLGGRSYYSFYIYSRNEYDRDHWWEPARRAWFAMPWEPIDAVTRLTG